jgi:hypothetical protein
VSDGVSIQPASVLAEAAARQDLSAGGQLQPLAGARVAQRGALRKSPTARAAVRSARPPPLLRYPGKHE